MAWMNQERKKVLAAAVAKVVPKDWKYTLSVRHHSTIVFTLRQAPVDILQDLREHGFQLEPTSMHVNLSRHTVLNSMSPEVGNVFKAVFDTLYSQEHGWYDKSEPMTDYFNTAWYVDVQVGEWDNPFLHVVKKSEHEKNMDKLAASAYKHKNHGKMSGKKYGTGSSEFSGKVQKKLGVYAQSKMQQYLPAGWMNFTPGKKAAATKKAMKLAGFA